MSEQGSRIQFRFESDGFDPEIFQVLDFEGVEEISSIYEFTINIGCTDMDIDMATLSREGARLILTDGEEDQVIHGVLSECHQTGTGDHVAFFRVVLVPRLWLLSLQIQNQVHQDQKVGETLKEELEQSGLVEDEDFAIRLTRSDYPVREYIVQYEESDLDFLCRQMEHYGIFFYFEQGEEKEKLIIADANSAFPTIAGESNIAFQPLTGMSEDEEVVRALVSTQNRMPEKVILSDYNYRTPSVPLRVEHPVSSTGRGIVSNYGDHFKTPEEGTMLAEIRSQEILATELVIQGEATVSRFRAGHTYVLEEHPRADMNGQSFLLTRVQHDGTQPLTGETDVEEDAGRYAGTFTMIPAETVYRPPRKTPKPKLYGVLNAKVDAAGSGQYAEIDDDGRYKVKLPFDLTDSGDGQASRFIRKAEPYAGPGYGQHFPLHKDCEVLLTCVEGDPDRPVICGAVPNPEQASPVSQSNQQVSQIRTASGIMMEMDDSSGSERIKMTCPHSETYFHLGAPNQGEPGAYLQSAGLLNMIFGNDINTHTDTNRSDNTQGDSSSTVHGTHNGIVHGVADLVYNSSLTRTVVGEFQELKHADSTTKTIGQSNSVKVGQTNSLWVGNKNGVSVSANHTETAGTNVTLKQSLDLSHTMGAKASKDDATDVMKDANLIQEVDTTWDVTVGSAAFLKAGGPYYVEASRLFFSTDGDAIVKADGKLTLQVGGSKVEITGSKITLKAADVLIDGQLTVTKPAKLDRNATST
ncbi:MAG: type VI secretion system tip protein TssI/VgrG [Myxococcota bacterium]